MHISNPCTTADGKDQKMTTGQDYATQLQTSYDDLWKTLQRFDEREREQANMRDNWTPKALLAHIAFWDDFQTRRMQAALNGVAAETGVIWPVLDNDQRIAIDRERDWDDIVAEANVARQCMIEFAGGLSNEALAIDYAEGMRSLSLDSLLRHMVAHTQFHGAELIETIDQQATGSQPTDH